MQYTTYGSSKSFTVKTGRKPVFKLRKHRVQMTPQEIAAAESLVHSFESFDVNNVHLIEEMQKDNISFEDVRDTLRYGAVIEVNSLGRCVVRLMQGRRAGTVVVIDVRKRHLVTAWFNRPNDNHKTLRMNEYTWRVDVTQYLGELR